MWLSRAPWTLNFAARLSCATQIIVLSGVGLRYLFVGTSPLRIVARTFYQPWYRIIPSIRVDVAILDSHTTLAGGDGGIVADYELAGTGKDELQTLSLVAAPNCSCAKNCRRVHTAGKRSSKRKYHLFIQPSAGTRVRVLACHRRHRKIAVGTMRLSSVPPDTKK